MTSLANNLNGIASGTTVTTSNSGGTSGSAFSSVSVPSGGSITADSAAAKEGATGLRIVYPSSTNSGSVSWTISAAVGVRISASFWYKFGALPSTIDTIFNLGAGSGGTVRLGTTGALQVANGTGGLVNATAVSAGTWVFVQLASTPQSGTTARIECIITSTSGTVLLSYDSGATLSGVGAVSTVTIGHPGFSAVANTHDYDLLAVDNTLSSGFPGPAAPTPALSNTAVPTITGTAQVGQTLTASNGTWSATPDSYTYQWNRAGTPISGATASTYVPVTADIGSTLTVTVTAAKAGYTSASATSAATAAVVAGGDAKSNLTGGSTFTAKPAKSNLTGGTTFTKKQAKRWTGSAWVPTNF